VENLRVVSLARSELAVASRVADATSERTAVIQGAIDKADAHIDAVNATFTDETSDDLRAAFTEFRAAVDDQSLVLLDTQSDADVRRNAEVATGEAFSTLSTIMRSEQEAAIEGLESDNDLMNLIATISTFIVAFVVPSAALFVFQALRSAPRELRSLRREHDRLARRSAAMASIVKRESNELRERLADSDRYPSTDELRRRLLRFVHIAAQNGAPTALNNKPINVNTLLAEVIDDLGARATVRVRAAKNPQIIADSEQVRLVVNELVFNALTHGKAPFETEALSKPHGIEIRVIDSGDGLPDDVVHGAIRDEDHVLREAAIEGALGYGLIAVRRALESTGGWLQYERIDGRTILVAALPSALPKTRPASNESLAA